MVDLYHFAHHFDMQSLLHVLRWSIVHHLKLQTAIQVLQLANYFVDQELKHQAKIFIAQNFSRIVSNGKTIRYLYDLSDQLLIELVVMDSIYATELQVLFTCLRWLAAQENDVLPHKVLQNVRWSLMSPEMLKIALSPSFDELYPPAHSLEQQYVHSSKSAKPDLSSNITSRRFHGRPTATVVLSVVAPPPQAANCNLNCNLDTALLENRSKRGLSQIENRRKRSESIQGEQKFEYGDLSWTFRAELLRRDEQGCKGWRLAVRLWLEEDENGVLWTRQTYGRGIHIGFPIEVRARCMVFDTWGGQLHSCHFNVKFQRSGWTNGWCIQDVFDGEEATEAFISGVRRSFGVGVMQVAIEMRIMSISK